MAGMRRFRGARRGGYRPGSDWTAAAVWGGLFGSGGTETFAIYDPSDPAATPVMGVQTLLRTRGKYLLTRDTTDTSDGVSTIAMGIGVAPAEAVAATNGVPTPWTDAGWDGWLWHTYDYVLGDLRTNDLLRNPSSIDSQAMRRLEDNVLFLAIELVNVQAPEGPDVIFQVDLRLLFQPSGKR